MINLNNNVNFIEYAVLVWCIRYFEDQPALHSNMSNPHRRRSPVFTSTHNRPTHTQHPKNPLDTPLDLQNRQLPIRNIPNTHHNNNNIPNPKLPKIHKIKTPQKTYNQYLIEEKKDLKKCQPSKLPRPMTKKNS